MRRRSLVSVTRFEVEICWNIISDGCEANLTKCLRFSQERLRQRHSRSGLTGSAPDAEVVYNRSAKDKIRLVFDRQGRNIGEDITIAVEILSNERVAIAIDRIYYRVPSAISSISYCRHITPRSPATIRLNRITAAVKRESRRVTIEVS